jgi:transposase InsO family protein
MAPLVLAMGHSNSTESIPTAVGFGLPSLPSAFSPTQVLWPAGPQRVVGNAAAALARCSTTWCRGGQRDFRQLTRRPRVGARAEVAASATDLATRHDTRDLQQVLCAGNDLIGTLSPNAAAESFIATIKKELINRRRFRSRNQARLAIFDYIECFYNPVRRHSSLGHRSAIEFEEAVAKEQPENARIGGPQGVH